MKKLLYLIAFALFITSCSVDHVNDETSIYENDLQTRAVEAEEICATADLLNQKGEYRGTVDAYVDWKASEVVLIFTTVDWKIKESKIFFGPEENLIVSSPDLYALGKYTYKESFKEGVYKAEFYFELNNVESDFSLMASINTKNDFEEESLVIDGPTIPSSKKLTYAKEFIKFCLEKP